MVSGSNRRNAAGAGTWRPSSRRTHSSGRSQRVKVKSPINGGTIARVQRLALCLMVGPGIDNFVRYAPRQQAFIGSRAKDDARAGSRTSLYLAPKIRKLLNAHPILCIQQHKTVHRSVRAARQELGHRFMADIDAIATG